MSSKRQAKTIKEKKKEIKSEYEFTGVLAILGTTGLHEDLEVDKAERHEAQRQPSHHSGKAHQPYDDKHIQPELRPTTGHLRSHLCRSLLGLLDTVDRRPRFVTVRVGCVSLRTA